jgi:hypothetical protein
MKITLLTPEESLAHYNEIREENKSLTREQVLDWAQRLPKGMKGNTDYLLSDEWDAFYKWIVTDEGYQQWQIDLDIVDYIKNYSFKLKA